MDYIEYNITNIESYLKELNQKHILEEYFKHSESEKMDFIDQINKLEKTYPGGIREYIKRAKVLLTNSKNNVNPYAKFVPSVPEGINIDLKSDSFHEFEKIGLNELEYTGFVLVAGGLGERLGYDDIKIGIPSELITGRVFFQVYADYILAYEDRVNKHNPNFTHIPLCIMVSDDTHLKTVKLLEQHNYFGLKLEQISIVKQEKVPALLDNDCDIALLKDKLLIDTKPHGHGDVHTLLYQSGIVEKWHKEGRKWIVFFQDTNALIFNAVPSALGVSVSNSFVINSITIPRKPGEAMGGICKLTDEHSGKTITLNVEYNQLDALLRDKWNPNGDITNENGLSYFPGNTNVLVFCVDSYLKTLKRTKGLMPEFVNPKYADEERNKFKSPTRLECMMQDYPQLLQENEKVGFTMYDKWFVFSTCKNNLKDGIDKLKKNLGPETAFSVEQDIFNCNLKILKDILGVMEDKNGEENIINIQGVDVVFGPKLIIHPSFAITIDEITRKVTGKNSISNNSVLILKGAESSMNNIELDGCLELTNQSISNQKIQNSECKTYKALDPNQHYDNYLVIRGYSL
jgi:UDP-sugar pyrophosphorylase